MTFAVNYQDVVAQLEAAGLILDPKHPLAFDARIQRWHISGEDRERRGWSRLKEWTSKSGHVYIVGVFGVWRGNDEGRIRVELPKQDGNQQKLSKEDITAIREAQKAAQKKLDEERKAEAKRAARWAAQIWAHCQPAESHDYLERKRIGPNGTRILHSVEGLSFDGLDDSNFYRLQMAVGALVVPMHNEHGNVCGIQFIYPHGHERAKKIERDKEFWPSGMAMSGTFGMIGPLQRSGIMLISEGFATAASLYEDTGQTVAYAFSANNLVKAGKLLRKTCPNARLLFCADDDYLTPGNPGVTAAVNATAEIERSAWIKPDFTGEDGNDRREGKKLTDYNDLAVLTGIPIILARQINAKLDELKWRDAASLGAGTQSTGEGESEDGRRIARSIMSIDELVARFIPIDDGSGKVVFDQWTKRIVMKAQMVELLPAGMRGDDIKRHPQWAARGAVYVDQIGFDPAGDEPHIKLNTWRGWPMKPKHGSCALLLDLLEYLCSGEGSRPDLVDWVLRWMAYPLQHPGAKMQSALILHGKQGTGKSTVFKVLAEIYGDKDSYRNYSVILDQRALESQFNSDWDSKLYVLAEEVINSSDKWSLKNELKELVTGHRIRIQKKFLDAYYQTNRCNITFLSNEDAPLPLDNDDRRHCVIWTPPPVSKEFYAEVREEIESGGVEAFYDYLMNLDLGDFRPWTAPPMTEAKQALIAASKSSEDDFLHDWVNGETPYPVCACRGDDLFAAYLQHCHRAREKNVASRRRFRIKLAHLNDWEHRKQVYVYKDYRMQGEKKQARLELPGLSWMKNGDEHRKKPEEDQADWATRCLLDFKKSLEEETSGGSLP